MIPLYKVNLPPNLGQTLQPIFDSGTITEGDKSHEFETKFQDYISNPYTALVNSGTSALTLAYVLAGVGPGTEVIASPLTCLAGTEPILTLGGKVVWCDIDPKTGNIDPEKIEALITSKTRAIYFVDWAGTPADISAINFIAHKYGIKTVEDAAHALGSSFEGMKTGTNSSYTCFSFQAIKHLTTIDGGALACSTKEDYDRAVLLRWFGLKRGHNKSPVCWEGDVPEPGYKFHMNNVNATIGIEQLLGIDKIIDAHKRNAAYLMKHLKGIDGLELCQIPENIDSSFWIFTIKLRNALHRASVSEALEHHGIASNITHTRNDKYSLFGESNNVSLPALDKFSTQMLNIPCGWWCSQTDLDYIVQTLEQVV